MKQMAHVNPRYERAQANTNSEDRNPVLCNFHHSKQHVRIARSRDETTSRVHSIEEEAVSALALFILLQQPDYDSMIRRRVSYISQEEEHSFQK
jgi:hypothetical protein